MKTIVPAHLNADKDKLVLLDQTVLPEQEVYLELTETASIWEAIRSLRVRGAPAIGITAGFALYLAIKYADVGSPEELRTVFDEACEYLATSRPTAVNLFWALKRMTRRYDAVSGRSNSEVVAALLEESEAILEEDQSMGRQIGEHALKLLKPEMGILTHCNAGGLATSGFGTALAPIYLGQEKNYNFKVFADETRPLLQGSRLTAYELNQAGVDVTVICDDMAALVMKKGWIDAVLVGCDRVAANGDTANKIGTSGVALLAKAYGIPMYVLGSTSTIDLDTPTGNEIEIELRDSDEIGNGFGRRTSPVGVKVYNPAFDVTDAADITAIITEKDVVYPPYSKNLAALFAE